MSRLGTSRPMFLTTIIFGACSLFAATDPPPKPQGTLVDLGGHRLHVHCSGKGGPTVVVENGLGDFSFDWSLVQSHPPSPESARTIAQVTPGAILVPSLALSRN
jgi:hypothetical protein